MNFRQFRGGAAARATFWAAVAFAFVMAILPHPPEVPGEPNDKIQHIMAFVALSLLAPVAYPRAGHLRLFGSLSALGAMIEFVQAIPALHRDSDVIDWIADTAAIGVVLLFVWWWRARR